MNVFKGSWILAALAGLALAVPARAQYDETRAKTFSIEAGGAYMLDSGVRDATKDVGWRVGVGYILPSKSLLSAAAGTPSLDLSYTEDKSGGNKYTIWSLTYDERVPFSAVATTTGTNAYWGLGLGAARVKGESEAAAVSETEAAVTGSGSETKTRLSARALLGMDFGGQFYIEGSYNYTGKVFDVETHNIGLVVGARF